LLDEPTAMEEGGREKRRGGVSKNSQTTLGSLRKQPFKGDRKRKMRDCIGFKKKGGERGKKNSS